VYRARAAAEAAVDSLVEQRLGSAPAPATQADAAQQLASLVGEIATTCTLAEIAAQTTPVTAPDPESALQHAELSRRFVEALAKLPARERSVVHAVYFEAQTIEQAGRAMGLSKSWASRLHARAIALLREQLEALGGDW
jgi:RNA polymerase sigma factor for flagellar operon FliA